MSVVTRLRTDLGRADCRPRNPTKCKQQAKRENREAMGHICTQRHRQTGIEKQEQTLHHGTRVDKT